MIALLLPLHNNLFWDPPEFAQAPEERSLFVAQDPRSLATAETRLLSVAEDPRKLDAPGETRSLAVDAENRRL